MLDNIFLNSSYYFLQILNMKGCPCEFIHGILSIEFRDLITQVHEKYCFASETNVGYLVLFVVVDFYQRQMSKHERVINNKLDSR